MKFNEIPDLGMEGDIVDDAVTVLKPGVITNGKFSISLGVPKNGALTVIPPQPEGVTVSDTSAKAYGMSIFSILKDGTGDKGRLVYYNRRIGIGYCYVDRDCSIKGNDTTIDDVTVIYAIDFKAGWNTVLTDEVLEGEKEILTVKNGIPGADCKWYASFD